MGISKMFARSKVSAATAQPAKTMTYAQVKEALKKLPKAQLEKVLSDAEKRMTPERMPITIKALSDLHLEAKYEWNGQGKSVTQFVDITRNASAFVNLRNQCVGFEECDAAEIRRMTERLAQAWGLDAGRPSAPVALLNKPKVRRLPKRVMWAEDVIDVRPSPDFLAKARRKAHS